MTVFTNKTSFYLDPDKVARLKSKLALEKRSMSGWIQEHIDNFLKGCDCRTVEEFKKVRREIENLEMGDFKDAVMEREKIEKLNRESRKKLKKGGKKNAKKK